MGLTPDDRRALRLYFHSAALAEVGLAPLVLDVAHLTLTPSEGRALIERLVTIAEYQAKGREARRVEAEASRSR